MTRMRVPPRPRPRDIVVGWSIAVGGFAATFIVLVTAFAVLSSIAPGNSSVLGALAIGVYLVIFATTVMLAFVVILSVIGIPLALGAARALAGRPWPAHLTAQFAVGVVTVGIPGRPHAGGGSAPGRGRQSHR